MAMEVVPEEVGGDGNVQCTNHPYRNSAPGGICALCLQEKLGNLVSSSFSLAFLPSSSSSSSPSFRSDFNAAATTASSQTKIYNARRSRLPFVKNKEQTPSDSNTIVFKRSKSTATPRRGLHNFLYGNNEETNNRPPRSGFWSFLYTTSSKPAKKTKPLVITDNVVTRQDFSSPDDEAAAAFDRKVSRSRSVGCGSRSFSGDLFERISNGFGDCTLRRVESQREGKVKVQPSKHDNRRQDCINERVRCGGIFSGFMISSSSSSSSFSSYLVSEDNNSSSSSNVNGKAITGGKSHGRSRSWGWALASPMRVLGKTASGKKLNKNQAPNLAAIPSLLTVSG